MYLVTSPNGLQVVTLASLPGYRAKWLKLGHTVRIIQKLDPVVM